MASLSPTRWLLPRQHYTVSIKLKEFRDNFIIVCIVDFCGFIGNVIIKCRHRKFILVNYFFTFQIYVSLKDCLFWFVFIAERNSRCQTEESTELYPACDKRSQQWATLCNLLQARRQLAFRGFCKVNISCCQQSVWSHRHPVHTQNISLMNICYIVSSLL